MNDFSKDFAKSDDLIWMLEFISRVLPSFNGITFIRFHFIIDANVLLPDIRYLIKNMYADGARTGLLEVLQAKVVEFYAPTWLLDEMQEKVPLLAKRYGFSISQAFQVWEKFSEHIKFIDSGCPADAPEGTRDPKDWPYIALQRELEHPIITNDKDIPAMGGAVADIKVIASLRDYARSSANALSIVVGGTVVAAIPFAIVASAISFLSGWIGRNLPGVSKWLSIGAVVLILVLILYPPGRQWLKEKVKGLSSSVQAVFSEMYITLQPIIDAYEDHKDAAASAKDAASAMLKEQ